ncbi:hypothetical protein HY485_02405, partial [Candidatus Woesearchaeota archaeon]|nr:hypothetical protein [Candidatus Woesearchaeota archaeon]
ALSGALLFSGISCADIPPTDKNLPSHNSLKSVPDKGTILDKELSEKCRKVAEYVWNKECRPAQNFLGYVDRFEDNNKKYLISVYPSANYGVIEIFVGMKGSQIMVTDYGLDGICNFGMISDAQKGEPRMFDDFKEPAHGLEHKDFYQRELNSAIDDIIKFYKIDVLKGQ